MAEVTTMDNLEVIKDELRRYGGRQKQAGEYHMVQCAFHEDGTPSMGIYMRRDNPNKTLGWFNCLGCGAHGNWNEFAEKAGLQPIKEWNNKENQVEYDQRKNDNALLGETGMTLRAVCREMHCPEAQPWPTNINWRGVSGKLIAAVGGHAINDAYNEGLAVLFPIRIGKRVRGAVKAIYEKKTKNQLGYITMGGEWVKRYGLFPYGYTSDLIAEYGHTFVILVEGPRDALRLLKMGLPAVAVLGANTISRMKMMYITSLGVEQIYCMPDNDKAGKKLYENIKNYIPEVRYLKLPRPKDENGKLIKMDPFSMPATIAKEVRRLMRERHGWVNPKREEQYA